MNHPCTISLDRLLDWQEGRLDGAASDDVRRHVESGCSSCRERLDWLAGTLALLPQAIAPEPVPSASAQAYALSLARLLQPAAQSEGIVRRIARLISEGTRLPSSAVAAGARGTTAPALHRVFEAVGYRVSLWDEPEEADERRRYLIGQVYAHGEGHGNAVIPQAVSLLLPDATEREATRDGTEFHLSNLTPGVYLIRCRLQEAEELLLPQVAVGQA